MCAKPRPEVSLLSLYLTWAFLYNCCVLNRRQIIFSVQYLTWTLTVGLTFASVILQISNTFFYLFHLKINTEFKTNKQGNGEMCGILLVNVFQEKIWGCGRSPWGGGVCLPLVDQWFCYTEIHFYRSHRFGFDLALRTYCFRRYITKGCASRSETWGNEVFSHF